MMKGAVSQVIDFKKSRGLVPVIAQDQATGEVLMLAYMNREAFEETVATGRACYYSRSRGKLWRKGEESGNFQTVREIRIDCDQDTILLKVEQEGDKVACHKGYWSCFHRRLEQKRWRVVEQRKVDPASYGRGYANHSRRAG